MGRGFVFVEPDKQGMAVLLKEIYLPGSVPLSLFSRMRRHP
jgi:hypothetical protein